MPRAVPIHHPSADELSAAHATYVEHEERNYAWHIARRALIDPVVGAHLSEREAVDLLLRSWNGRSSYTHQLTLGAIENVVDATSQDRASFDGRALETFNEDDHPVVAEVYLRFRTVMGPTGAAKALGLLHPRFLPIWDSRIGNAYIGYRWSRDKATPEAYLTFVDYCREQCTTDVDEAAFGPTLLKTLDEWNYCIWSKGWLPPPGP